MVNILEEERKYKYDVLSISGTMNKNSDVACEVQTSSSFWLWVGFQTNFTMLKWK